jgi:GxxExxY protein
VELFGGVSLPYSRSTQSNHPGPCGVPQRLLKRKSIRTGGTEREITFPLLCRLHNRLPVHPLLPKASALTETVIAGAIEVHRHKGPGLIESIYEWCLLKELGLRSLGCVTQKLVVIEYKGFTREEPLRFDILVEDCLLVEAKAVEKISQSTRRNS